MGLSGDGASAKRRFGFPKSRRIRRRRDFLRAQDLNVRVTTAHLVLLLAAREAPGPSRLGIVASKKVGCAVQRNRTKRLIREVFRLYPGLFPEGLDIVAIAKPGASELTLAELRDQALGVAQVLARRARLVLRK